MSVAGGRIDFFFWCVRHLPVGGRQSRGCSHSRLKLAERGVPPLPSLPPHPGVCCRDTNPSQDRYNYGCFASFDGGLHTQVRPRAQPARGVAAG